MLAFAMCQSQFPGLPVCNKNVITCKIQRERENTLVSSKVGKNGVFCVKNCIVIYISL